MVPFSIPILLHLLIVAVLGLRIIYRKLPVSVTLAWIFLIVAIPAVGIIMYFLFGDHSLSRRRLVLGTSIRKHYQENMGICGADAKMSDFDASPFFKSLSKAIAAETGFHPSSGNKIALFDSADDTVAAIIKDIKAAKKTCFLEFFIVDPRGIIEDVLKEFIAAAERGVDCRILVDAIGSKALFKSEWVGKLEAAGIQVVKSLALGVIKSISKRSDLRNHRKIIIIDQKIAYTGSFNLIDPRYFKRDLDVGPWVDIMARMEGQVVSSFSCIFNTDFIFDNSGVNFDYADLTDLPDECNGANHKRDAVIQVIPSGPEMRSSIVYETLVAAIFGARKRVVICTPYFIPDEALVMAITNAAKRGIEVTLIVPKKLDSTMANYASQSSFEPLLEAGVKIAQFTAGLIHTKSMIIDDNISLIGTVNMDMRSFFLNLELMVYIYDKAFTQSLSKIVDTYLESSIFIPADHWKERSPTVKFKENVLRLVGPLL